MKGVAVLGSTGSVGRQTLDVIGALGDRFTVVGLAAGNNAGAVFEQAALFHPKVVCIASEEAARAGGRPPCGVELWTGEDAAERLAAHPEVDIAVAAIGGFDGLGPVLAAARSGKRIAIACKEALVAAGGAVLEAARAGGAEIIPVDSEHSAVFQCLEGQKKGPSRILLTASGGPFRGLTKEELERVGPSQALKHPNWKMGPKVTVDSATLMNKGLEVIEAHVLFGVPYDNIEVVVHPQSIIHSMVELDDGSVLAQMAAPDMRLPIRYALTYPDRASSRSGGLRFWDLPALTFERPDLETFPALRLGYEAGRAGGTMPAVLSAADEVAVGEFLAGRLNFTAIPQVVERVMERHSVQECPGLEDLVRVDGWARSEAARVCRDLGLRGGAG